MCDEMSEGAYLDSMSDGGAQDEMDEQELDMELANLPCKVRNMKTLYANALAAKVGSVISCACGCNRTFVKKSYQSKFFRNKGQGNCKDTYWNFTNDTRRQRMLITTGALNSGSERGQEKADALFDMKADNIKAIGQHCQSDKLAYIKENLDSFEQIVKEIKNNLSQSTAEEIDTIYKTLKNL